MTVPNWPNKTVFVGDNLHVMRDRSHADLLADLSAKPGVSLV